MSQNPRYPRYLCRACVALGAFDEEGRQLRFHNMSLSGGLGVKRFRGEVLESQEDHIVGGVRCVVGGARCIAKEARFGGVVIEATDV